MWDVTIPLMLLFILWLRWRTEKNILLCVFGEFLPFSGYLKNFSARTSSCLIADDENFRVDFDLRLGFFAETKPDQACFILKTIIQWKPSLIRSLCVSFTLAQRAYIIRVSIASQQ